MGYYLELNGFCFLWGFPLLPVDLPFAPSIFAIYLAPTVSQPPWRKTKDDEWGDKQENMES